MDRHILIVDDDEDLSFIISEMLEMYEYQVTLAKNSQEAFSLLSNHTYQLLVLDVNLPDSTGFEICKSLREVSTVPVIFASARTKEDDRIVGLDIGGDDYITKPYSMKELLSRINALMRRTYGFIEEEEIITFGDVKVDIVARTVYKNRKKIALALKEFDVLKVLIKNKNKVITKEALLSEVWGAFNEVEPSTLTVHIRWLREKLENDSKNPQYIKTIWGVGYILEVEDEA